MRTLVFLLPFLIVSLSLIKHNEAKKKLVPLASSQKINEFLFNNPNATYLEDYKKNPKLQILRDSDDESKFAFERDVQFIFKSKSNQKGDTFTFEERNATNSEVIDATKPLRVIIHGWKNEANSPMIINVTEAYLQSQDVTLMIVDWSVLAKENYLYARDLIHDVANVTGYFIKYLIENNLAKISTIHFIGHSLGGHTVGLVGKKIQELGLEKIPLIFALDPAGPLFSLDEKNRRVDKDDAKFVVILHTSTLLGFTEPLGHVDFYANYGFSQPGCESDFFRTCAHSRAYMYFADAILSGSNETDFWAIKCNSEYDDIEAENCQTSDVETRFGESLHKEAESINGLFLFETNSEKPWVKPRAHLKDLGASNSSTINFYANN